MSREELFQALEARRRAHAADATAARLRREWVKAAVAQAWADAAQACLADAERYLADEPEANDYDTWVERAVGSYVP